MSNNGTGFDKYFRGWKEDGDPPHSRGKRERFAKQEGWNDYQDYLDWYSPRFCYCDDDDPLDLCGNCDSRSTDAARILAGRKKRKRYNGPSPHPYRRWRRNKVDCSLTACDGEPHLWKNRMVWIAREAGYISHLTGELVPHYMEQKRVMQCSTCGETVQMRSGWRRGPTRPMEPHEVAELEKMIAKRDRWKQFGTPKQYGVREDGTPVYRNEFKQGPKKRQTRKRDA